MKFRSRAVAFGLALAAVGVRADFRPPSVPIVSCDPFFSVWSGEIASGKIADIVRVDADFNLQMTFVGGLRMLG